MVAAFIYYGFSFSWSSLGSNIYISYLYAAIGEAIAYAAMVFPLDYWGRRSSNIMFYLVGKCLLRLLWQTTRMMIMMMSLTPS